MEDTEYLGDGLYVRLESNNQVVIFSSNGIQTTNIVYLDPEVLGAFKKWLQRNKL